MAIEAACSPSSSLMQPEEEEEEEDLCSVDAEEHCMGGFAAAIDGTEDAVLSSSFMSDMAESCGLGLVPAAVG